MKRTILVGCILAMCGSAAFAADLPSYRRPMQLYQQARVYDWSGFYIGANGGGLFGSTSAATDLGFGFNVDSTASGGAFFGGGQLGYRYQTGPFVFGVQVDGDWTNWSRKWTDAVFINYELKHTWDAAVTGRIGYAVDRVLISAYGGAALGGFRATEDVSAFGIAGESANKHLWGGRGGLQVDFALTREFSAGVFADYTKYQDFTHVNNTLGVTTVYKPDEFRTGIVLNYRF